MMGTTTARLALIAALLLGGCPEEQGSGGEATQTPAASPPAEQEAPAPAPEPAAETPTPPAAQEEPLAGEEPAGETGEDETGEETAEAPGAEGAEAAGEGSGTEPEMLEADGIRITELALAGSVESGHPVDPRNTFSKASDQRIYCFVRLENDSGEATEITIHWERLDGQGTRPAPLSVPASPRYSTFAYSGTRMPAGRYRCVVQSAQESLLGRIEYELTD